MGTSAIATLSGEAGSAANSARAGFLPIGIARAPLAAFRGIAVYLRNTTAGGSEAFTLYCSEHVRLTESTRDRLAQAGVKFVYIPIVKQSQFREQIEAALQDIVRDPGLATAAAAEIVYETSVELVNEILREPDLGSQSSRLESVSRAVTTLVLKDPSAFSHLYATSHHDFYTATHMVNVGTWMVPLAYAMGIRDEQELNQICHAGMVHDIGKLDVPAEILNKKGQLTSSERDVIRSHPEMGCRYLQKMGEVPRVLEMVTRQHHERLDGSGYPDGLKGEQIPLVSRICGVVDSFDAMTAFRPYKERTMSVSQAVNLISSEAPVKYDAAVVGAWIGMLRIAEKDGVLPEPLDISPPPGGANKNRRSNPRFAIGCPALAQVLHDSEAPGGEQPPQAVRAHSISRSGLGFLSPVRIRPGDSLRVELMGGGTLERTVEGLTVRCREYRDGWYDVGMEFADLQTLAGSLVAEPS